MTVTLPWYQVSQTEWRADTLFGQYRVVSNTYPRWHESWFRNHIAPGYTVYFRNKRIAWTLEGSEANAVAQGYATAEMGRRTKGRIAL